MMKKLMAVMFAAVMVFAMTACGGSGESDVDYSAITTDADNGTVTIYAQVNGMFFEESTMHAIVFQDGSQGDASMFAAFVDSQDFYDALVEVGAKTDDIKKEKITKGQYITGQSVEITATWDGQDDPLTFADLVVCSDGKLKTDFVFGGDKGNNADAGSGCITCLDSCWAGIVSNKAYPFGHITGGSMATMLNKDLGLEDGTIVKFTFTLK